MDKHKKRNSNLVRKLCKMLYEMKKKVVNNNAFEDVKGEIGSSTKDVRGLLSGMHKYAMKEIVDRIANNIAKIKRSS